MKRIATVLAALTLLLASQSASAQSSTCQAYNPQLCSESGTSGTSEGPTSAAASEQSSTGTLPFTGLDLGLLALGGGTLLIAGTIVRTCVKRRV